MNALHRATRGVVVSRGWQAGSTLEDEACMILHSYGIRPTDLRQQFRVGRYRLDFAAPDVKIALEIDGWQHARPQTAAKDAERDAWLRSQGWLVLRVDDRRGPDSLREQLVWPVKIIKIMRGRS